MGVDTGLKNTVPDLQAAKRIPIDRVADELGLERYGHTLRCWRPERHQHGDRTPSVGIWARKNRMKCFVCDARALSTVDLVSSVLGLKTFEALLWLANRFDIPTVPKGRHVKRRGESAPFRVGVSGNRLEAIVRSGLLAQMGDCEVRVLLVLDTFTDREIGCTRLSYAGLRRFAGIASNQSISRSLQRLRNVGAIEIEHGRGGDGLATCNSYRLTLESTRLLSLVHDCFVTTRKEVETERAVRERARRQRAKAIRVAAANMKKRVSNGPKPDSNYLPVTTLDTQCLKVHFPATYHVPGESMLDQGAAAAVPKTSYLGGSQTTDFTGPGERNPGVRKASDL
jgi:hypothetical protein